MSWDTFLPCLWPFTAGGGKEQRLVGTRVILSAPLGFVPQKTLVCERNTENQLSKGARGTHCRWGQSSLHKMSTALCKLSWNTGQRQTCLSPCLFQCFIRSFTLLENIQRVRAAFGVEQNCTTPAISHTSMPVYRRGASGPVVSKKTDSERLLFYSQHSEKSSKKNPKRWKSGEWVLCKTCNFCKNNNKMLHTVPDLAFPGQPSDSTLIKFSSAFPPGKNMNHYSHLKGQ